VVIRIKIRYSDFLRDHQYSTTKTFQDKTLFDFSNFGHWNFFDICDFDIWNFNKSMKSQQSKSPMGQAFSA